MDSFKKLRKEKEKKKKQFGLGGGRIALVVIDGQSCADGRLVGGLIEACNDIGVRIEKIINSEKRDELFTAADIAIVFDKKSRIGASERGCVPVAPLHDIEETRDYDPVAQNGNGFYFKKTTFAHILASTIRALETYRFGYDWENVMRECAGLEIASSPR